MYTFKRKNTVFDESTLLDGIKLCFSRRYFRSDFGTGKRRSCQISSYIPWHVAILGLPPELLILIISPPIEETVKRLINMRTRPRFVKWV